MGFSFMNKPKKTSLAEQAYREEYAKAQIKGSRARGRKEGFKAGSSAPKGFLSGLNIGGGEVGRIARNIGSYDPVMGSWDGFGSVGGGRSRKYGKRRHRAVKARAAKGKRARIVIYQ